MFRKCAYKYIILFKLLIALNLSFSSEISPDSKRLYHDIVSGHGLYNGFTKLTELGGSNFKNVVFNEEKNKLWLVEFYNSWCGHCHRFVPTWKSLSSDVYEWRDTVAVGAVDCSNDANNQLCRDMEVMYYPMIKLFPPRSNESFIGEDFKKESVDEMRNKLVSKLKAYLNDCRCSIGNVNLISVTDGGLESIWTDVPPEVVHLALVFEPEDSLVGSEVALDLSQTKQLQVRLVHPTNEHLSQVVGVEQGSNGIVIIKRDNTVKNLQVEMFTRVGVNKVLRQYLVANGVNIPLELPPSEVIESPDVNIADVMEIMQIEDDIKKKLHTKALSTVVFQLDLEGAIRYSLKNEIPLHRNITGEQLTALKNYLNILIKYFPFGQQGVNFLKNLKQLTVDDKSEISGKAFRQTFLQLEEMYKPFLPKQGWIGCRGSQPEYRGYPCSLWTLFHTLTIHEELRDRNVTGEGPDVLFAMASYVKNFFTCSECAGHFTEMAKTISGNVTTTNESILWLWAAHNRVNKRLAGDQTEDPQHKKIQFPSSETCPSCQSDNGSWNKSEVMNFLISMYSNIVYLQEDDLKSTTTTENPSTASVRYNKNLRHVIFEEDNNFKQTTLGSESKRSLWGFNIFDMSLCVVLYVCSVAILILVCIKFVFKRSYRKKPYVHDILSKV